MGKTIKETQAEMYAIAKGLGWWEKIGDRDMTTNEVATSLCLIHSEVSEALESLRKSEPNFFYAVDGSGKPEGMGSELADVIIRCMDLAEKLGIDLEEMIEIKAKYNKTRDHRHGGKVI